MEYDPALDHLNFANEYRVNLGSNKENIRRNDINNNNIFEIKTKNAELLYSKNINNGRINIEERNEGYNNRLNKRQNSLVNEQKLQQGNNNKNRAQSGKNIIRNTESFIRMN